MHVSLSTRSVYIVPLAGANRTRREPAAQTSRFLPTRPDGRLQRVAAVLVRPDPQSQRPVLSIPLPEWLTPEALGGAISGLLGKLSGTP